MELTGLFGLPFETVRWLRKKRGTIIFLRNPNFLRGFLHGGLGLPPPAYHSAALRVQVSPIFKYGKWGRMPALVRDNFAASLLSFPPFLFFEMGGCPQDRGAFYPPSTTLISSSVKPYN